ncbi:hypothetical protein ACG04R_20410 [Roseateles sp. BYS78W]|uniref:SPOR domain-containing protein n=1 Tax=Pelomonas candidula TaxID=3299025 RepID=A0ABW7HGL6_9BURK
MESPKPAPSVIALADELTGRGWRRSRKGARIVAVGAALVAASVLFGLFNRFGTPPKGEVKPARQLIASVDLSVGNPVAAASNGEARARADIEAGRLELHIYGPAPGEDEAAQAQRLKQRYGITRVYKGKTGPEVALAFAEGYNRVMRAEIERRHGRELADRLLPRHDSATNVSPSASKETP